MKGSFSHYGSFMQILLVIFLSLGGLVLFTSIGVLLGSLIYPFSASQIMDLSKLPGGEASTQLMMFLQGFATIGTFLVPGILGAYLLSEKPGTYLGTESFPRPVLVIVGLVLVMTLSGTTISDLLYRFSSSLPWPSWLDFAESWLRGAEDLMLEQMQNFLAMDSFTDFLRVFVVLALLPAVAEETLFRGVLQPIFLKTTRNIHAGVWITAMLFGLMHQQFNAFLSITALGAVLGYLRAWSGSLWVPVLMHLINNGLIVVLVYFFEMPYMDVASLSDTWEWYYALPAILIFFTCLFTLQKRYLRA